MADLSTGAYVAAGTLTELINAIKTEFARRANPYNKTRLDGVSISLGTADSKGNYTLAQQAKDALTKLHQVHYGSANGIPTAGTYLQGSILNTKGFAIVNALKDDGYTSSATDCYGACQGLCYGTCYNACLGCTGGSSNK